MRMGNTDLLQLTKPKSTHIKRETE